MKRKHGNNRDIRKREKNSTLITALSRKNKCLITRYAFKLCPLNEPDIYPNCDGSVWLRSCEEEIIEPIHGVITGMIPKWISGCLLRNGPGNLKVGKMMFNHLFDSSALLHKFAIKNGDVTYQCRFIQTESYNKNNLAKRIVMASFGTSAVSDPCQTIFQRVSSLFQPSTFSDNALISIYPFGDEYYAFTETPVIQRINVNTLETVAKLDVANYTNIVHQTSHPHIMNDGTVYNLGMSITSRGIAYNIICFPNGHHMFNNVRVVGTLPARWKLHPSYMHTFGITKNYFILIEQPLSISVINSLKVKFLKHPMASCFNWFANENTKFYLLCRKTGALKYTFQAEAFFYLHVINAFEINDYVVIDICCYKDPGMLDCMYVEAMQNMQRMPDYAKIFRGKPLRFVLPLHVQPNVPHTTTNCQEYENSVINNTNNNRKWEKEKLGNNLISLEGSKAEAYLLSDMNIFCVPECLCDLGCETPRINNEQNLGKEYKYFYAISADVDAANPGTLIKVDVQMKTRKIWCERNCYPSEPVFIPSIDSQSEDDGVVLSAIIWGRSDINRVGLLVLCAKTFRELGRCVFTTPGPVPKCLHGWFAPSKGR